MGAERWRKIKAHVFAGAMGADRVEERLGVNAVGEEQPQARGVAAPAHLHDRREVALQQCRNDREGRKHTPSFLVSWLPCAAACRAIKSTHSDSNQMHSGAWLGSLRGAERTSPAQSVGAGGDALISERILSASPSTAE